MRGILGTALAVCLLSGTSALAQTEEHHREDHPQGRPNPPAAAPGRPAPAAAAPRPAAPAAPAVPRMAPPASPAPPSGFRGGQDTYRGQPIPPRAPEAQRGDRGGDQRDQQRDQRGAPNAWQGGRDRPDGGRGPDVNRAPDAYRGAPDYRGGPERRDDRDGRFDNRDHRDGDRGGDRGGWDRRPDGRRPSYDPGRYPRQFYSQDRYRWRGGEWRAPPGFYYRHWNYGDYLPRGWFNDGWFIQDWFDYGLSIPPYGFEWVRSGPDALLIDERTGFVVQAVYGVFY